MSKSVLFPLYKYLESQNINLDKKEFNFQFNSHPDYPSLLSLSDTLSFFEVNNGALKIDSLEVDLLPNNFIARLKKGETDFFSFIKKRKGIIQYTDENEQTNTITKTDFLNLWDDVVLLIENDDYEITETKSSNKLSKFLTFSCLLLFLVIAYGSFRNKLFSFFYFFPTLGLFLSISALKDLFNTKSKLLNKFCNITSTSSCETVVNSTKWKTFNVINFSDLSIVFFSTQILALFLMGLSGYFLDYFIIQTVLLFCSIPVVVLSLYYQYFIEKKWCPLCLTIIAILIFELVYLFFKNTLFNSTLSLNGSLIFVFATLTIVTIWLALKSTLKKINYLKKEELKANRFKRNYNIFKRSLISKPAFDFKENQIYLGNKNAELKIVLITNPFCSFCKEPHLMLEKLLKRYRSDIKISLIYNFDVDGTDDENVKTLFRNLINIRLKKDEISFIKSINDWYENKDINKWLNDHKEIINNEEVDSVLNSHNNWCDQKNLHFTPCLFINGYLFPEIYDISDLNYFIDELVYDKSNLV